MRFFEDVPITNRTGGNKTYADAETNLVGYTASHGETLLSAGSYPLSPCTVCTPMLIENGVQIVPIP
jgi:hypothetical protein